MKGARRIVMRRPVTVAALAEAMGGEPFVLAGALAWDWRLEVHPQTILDDELAVEVARQRGFDLVLNDDAARRE